MNKISLQREDFVESEYFDYVLAGCGIPLEKHNSINEVTLIVMKSEYLIQTSLFGEGE